MNARKSIKYILFADLYFPEGLCDVLVPILIPLYFVEKGVPISIITLVIGISWIPWIIKFIWSSPIDKSPRFGKKTFIYCGGLIAIVCFLLLIFIDPSIYLLPFTIILFVSQGGQSLLDSATDAWAVNTIKKDDRGKINSAMYLGKIIGGGASVLILSQVAKNFGYPYIFLITAIIVSLTLLLPLFVREVKTINKIKKATTELITELKKKSIRLLLLYTPLIGIGGGLLGFTLPIFANTVLNLDVAVIGMISTAETILVIPVIIIGGILIDRWDRKKLIYIMGIPSIFLILSFTLTREVLLFLGLYFSFVFISCSMRNANFALIMDATNPKLGGVQFSLYNGLASGGLIFAGTISGFLVENFGFNAVFILSAIALVPPLIILYFIHTNKEKAMNSNSREA